MVPPNRYPWSWHALAVLEPYVLSRTIQDLQRLKAQQFMQEYPQYVRSDGQILPTPLSLAIKCERIYTDIGHPTESARDLGLGYVQLTSEAAINTEPVDPEELSNYAYVLTDEELEALPWPLYVGQKISVRGTPYIVLIECGSTLPEARFDCFFLYLTTTDNVTPSY